MSTKKSILVIDDEQDVVEILQEWLQDTYTVVTASDGITGLAKLTNQSFDLVISDLKMPKLDGMELLSRMRADKHHKNIPVIILSGMEQDDEPIRFKYVTYIPKTLDRDPLLEKIASFIENPSGARQDEGSDDSNGNFRINVDVVNAVVNATKSVITGFGLGEIEQGQLQLLNIKEPVMGDISAVVDMKGDTFWGKLCITFEETCFLKIMESLLGEEQTGINEENRDGAAELCNMIFGNAKRDIEVLKLEMAIPTIISGTGHTISHKEGTKGMMIPFRLEHGWMYMLVLAEPVKS